MNEGKDLEEMKFSVQDNGEVPKEDIGDLGEQFTKALFKEVDIRREDEEIFKERLKEILNAIQNDRFERQKFPIVAKIGNYTVEFEKRGRDGTMLTFGTIYKPASNLINTLRKRNKMKQIEKSDILLLIILNDLVEKEFELLGELYRPMSLGINFLGEGPVNKFITQYRLEETVWFNTRLKCVIAVYLGNKNVVICPSLCHYEEFSAIEYAILRKLIENKGFKVDSVVHSSTTNGKNNKKA